MSCAPLGDSDRAGAPRVTWGCHVDVWGVPYKGETRIELVHHVDVRIGLVCHVDVWGIPYSSLLLCFFKWHGNIDYHITSIWIWSIDHNNPLNYNIYFSNRIHGSLLVYFFIWHRNVILLYSNVYVNIDTLSFDTSFKGFSIQVFPTLIAWTFNMQALKKNLDFCISNVDIKTAKEIITK